MNQSRIKEQFELYRVPDPPVPAITPAGFILFPMAFLPALSAEQQVIQLWIYQRAFEEAQAVARPSILERDLLAVWN